MKFNIILILLLMPVAYSRVPQPDETSPGQLDLMDMSEHKVDLLNKLASQVKNKDTSLALEYLKESLKMSRDLNYARGEALACKSTGFIRMTQHHDASALKLLQEALHLFQDIDDKKEVSNCLDLIAHIHYSQNNFKEALVYLKQAKALELEQGNIQRVSKLCNNMGMIYKNLNQSDAAMEQYSKSLELEGEDKTDRSLAIYNNNMGSVWIMKGDIQKGIGFYTKSLEIKEKLRYKEGIALSCGNLADAYIILAKSSNNKRQKKKNLYKAIEFAERSLTLGREVENLSIQKYAYMYLSTSWKQLKQFQKALENYEQFVKIHEKLYSREKAQAIAELEASFKTSDLERQNHLLRQSQEDAHKRLTLEEGLRNALIALVAVIFGCFVYILFSKRKLKMRNKQLRDLNQKIQDQTEAILESEARFRQIFNDSNDGFFWTDPDQKIIINCNRGAEILLESPLSDIIGKPTDFFFPHAKKEKYRSQVDTSLKETDSEKFRFEMITSSGKTKYVSSTISESIIEGKIIRQAVVRDVTKEVLAEEALIQREKELQSLNKALMEQRHVFMVGNVVVFRWKHEEGWPAEYVSENVPHVLGYSTEEFQKGKVVFTDLMTEEDKHAVEDLLQQSLHCDEETLEYPELKLQHKDGTWIWAYIFTTIHREKTGEITHFFGYLINITPRKEAQAALLLSESKLKTSNAAKDMFFSIIAHDLKSPFSNILGFCELLLLNYDRYTDEEKREFIKTIEISAENTYKLLENLLLWSKSQRGMLDIQAEPVNLFLLWSESFENIRDMAIRKDITITESFEKEITVLADKNMLQTVFRNLLSNAIKFTPKGAWIKVSAGYSQELPGFAICCVEDAGVGISPENTDKLFDLEEKYSTPGTEEEEGTGLGLILCKDFIEKHGGRIWVETEPGKGSMFYFSLPRA